MPDVTGLYRRFGVKLPDLADGWASTRCFTGAHQDRHPSMRVHLRAGTFKCFACGARGGVIDALQLLGVHDRGDARTLAIDYGVLDPPRRPLRPGRPALAGIQPAPVSVVAPPAEPERVDWEQVAAGPAVTHEHAWLYEDAAGVPVGRVRRLDLADGTKRIWQERPDGNNGWLPGMAGGRLPLYRLPQLLEHAARGDPVVVVEGEKAVDALDRLGVFATTNAGGAGKWRPDHTAALAGATVTAISDCDLAGRLHALELTDELLAAGVTVTMPIDPNELRHDGYDIVNSLAELADTIRAVAPAISTLDLRDRLRRNLELLLVTPLPATNERLQHLRERVRMRADPDGKMLLVCSRCSAERVHRIRYGLAYCPCGAHQPAPP